LLSARFSNLKYFEEERGLRCEKLPNFATFIRCKNAWCFMTSKNILEGQEIIERFNAKMFSFPDGPEKIWEIIDFANIYADTLGNILLPLLDQGISLSEKIGFKTGEYLCRYNKEFVSMLAGGQTAGGNYYQQGSVDVLLNQVKEDDLAYGFGLTFKAYNHWFKGEYDKGFEVIFAAVKLSEPGPSRNLAWSYYGLGVFYYDTKDLENSELYYSKALEVFEKLDHAYGRARSKTGVASVALQKKDTQRAASLLSESISVFRDLSHTAGLSRALNDLGMLEVQGKNYTAALEFLFESASLRQKLNHVQGLITTYTAIGEVYISLKEEKKALEFLSKALEISRTADAKQKKAKLHRLLATLNKNAGDVASAYSHLESFLEINSKLMSDESGNNIKRIQTKFETEKSEQIAEIERLKNVELKKAYETIESKNKDIHDSITYAKRIQTGILPSDADLKECFDDFFVLYLPKDIVSGDFYWAVKGTSQKTGETVSIIAAIDCTGHGVPGAFMSMLGNALLNQTIFDPNVIYPSDVLNYLNRELPKNLRSAEQNSDIKDGMDMSLCSFNFEKMKLIYAGANNPCWLVRDGAIIELKADKQPISASTDQEKRSFTDKSFDMKKGDMVYLFTDGYADQFGGPRGKKFKYKQLEEKLLEVSHGSAGEQYQLLKQIYLDWRGDLEQVDDVLLIGVRV
jgi:serine phosphatase RsbU (regulator of sigma subunit)